MYVLFRAEEVKICIIPQRNAIIIILMTNVFGIITFEKGHIKPF